MPFIDRIIEFLRSNQGERIVLESDQPCVIYRAGGNGALTKDRLTFSQITNLITEVMPDEHRNSYASGETVLFPYKIGNGSVDVEVSQIEGNLRVIVGLTGTLDQPLPPPPAPEAEPAPEPAAEPPPDFAPIDDLPGSPVLTGQSVHAGTGKRVGHIDELFRFLHEIEGSDLHLSSNERPMVRVHGVMKKLEEYEINDPVYLKKLLWDIAPQRNKDEWESDHDTDFAYQVPGLARFRCNIFMDRHGPGAVFRLIPTKLATVKDLNLAPALVELGFLNKGLVVVTGPTGSGKSTTLAALVDHINKNRTDHIITIEDPVEFVHEKINCLVTQREVHVHTSSFARALRAGLREDPDIILVGEMRDLETIAIAIETAETGHLVFGTLHTTTAASTVDRIIEQFPADQQEQIRVMLSESLRAVIAQTLCRTTDGRRVAAFEILIMDPACANLIREGKTFQLPSMMQLGRERGCITMNESLMAHVRAKRVDPKEAYLKAVDKAGILIAFNKEGIHIDTTSLA